jgi:hypothetical protein
VELPTIGRRRLVRSAASYKPEARPAYSGHPKA